MCLMFVASQWNQSRGKTQKLERIENSTKKVGQDATKLDRNILIISVSTIGTISIQL